MTCLRQANWGVRLALAAALVSTSLVVGSSAPAAAGGTRCFTGAPRTAAAFQELTLGRDARWGVGDLTSMVRLSDGRNLFLFGDTGYHDVLPDGRRGRLAGFGNNSAWVQEGACFTQLDNPHGNRSWIEPPERDGTVYWPGGAAVAGNRLHVFLTRMRLDNIWGTPLGSAVATFELPSLHLARIANVPFDPQRILGSGAVYDGGYLYTYGSYRRDCTFCFSGDVYLARVPEARLPDPEAWQYYAGSRWTPDPMAAVPVIPEAASNTNVLPWRNGYLLVTKTLNIVGPDVDAWWSPAPAGPWRKLGTIFRVPHPPPSNVPGYEYRDAFTYMATVLPTTGVEGGGVLHAYNVLSFDANDGLVDGRAFGPRFVSVSLPNPPAAPPRQAVPPAVSPWDPVVAADLLGRVRAAGGSASYARSHTTLAVGVARTVTGNGSWVVAADGGVFTVGDARFYGSTGGMRLHQPVLGIAPTPTGRGYWLVAADGGVFSFGDARFYGSTGGMRLHQPVVGMAATPTGRGYWLVAADGGVFSFGDARFYGSTGGMRLHRPVVGMAATPTGRGYYMVASDGGVFAFGDARFHGSGPQPAMHRVVGMSVVPGGYRLVDASGRVHHRGASHGPGQVGPPSWVPLVAAG